jgi:hypothetical protein
MAATVSVKECSGSPAVAATITNSRFCTADEQAPGTNYPLVVPPSGYYYSYWKTYFLNSDSGLTGTINNIKWYTDGAIGWSTSGVIVSGCTHDTYMQATGIQSTSGDLWTHTTMADIATYTSASPLSVTGSLSSGNGRASDFVVLQARVANTAVATTLPTETITWRYDET